MKRSLTVAVTVLMGACAGVPTDSRMEGKPAPTDSTGSALLAPGDLRVWPGVDTLDAFNHDALACLRRFLSQKLQAGHADDHWYAPDRMRYGAVYPELLYAEYDTVGYLKHWPTLLRVTPTEDGDQRLLTVRWAAEDASGAPGEVRYVFDFLARRTDDGMRLSFPIEHFTRHWERRQEGAVLYVISPQHRFDPAQAGSQRRDLERLSHFFGIDPFPITFYSFANATELFRSKGFQQHPLLHAYPTGGMVDEGANVYSGNDKDIYTHEIVHLFVMKRFQAAPDLLNEGVATLLGGSVERDYAWHRARMARYLVDHPEVDLADHTNTFDTDLLEGETAIPYVVGALICEHVLRNHGREGLHNALGGTHDLWEALAPFGLERNNLSRELRALIRTPLQATW